MRLFNVRDIKVKATNDLKALTKCLSMIREQYPNNDIRIDANGDWDNIHLAIRNILPFSITAIEQPVISNELGKIIATKDILNENDMLSIIDEGLCSLKDTQTIIQCR